MIEKPLTLVSLNVRGMRGGMAKLEEIRVWFVSLQIPPQILLIQEHHIGKEDN
jgi:hypothetical protein